MKSKGLLIAICTLSFALFSFVRFTDNNYFEITKNIEIFSKLYKEVNQHYADELDPTKLMKTGIDAMMNSLDPYTVYYSESQIEGYRFQQEGKYAGIGANMKLIDGYVTITELLENSPVVKAGINIGDQIRELEGVSVKGKTVNELMELFKTYSGDSVELGIKSARSNTLEIRVLKKGEVVVENVPFSGYVAEGIAYVNLTTFTRTAAQNVKKNLLKLKEENPEWKGIILDLRGNGGGLLNEAIALSNVFIPKNEKVVSTKGKIKENDNIYFTREEPMDIGIPLVVLVNGNSASASEIVSGVMQDYDRGVLIGQRTYGKGLVQNTREVGYNSRVKITTSKYYIPSERCIQAVEYKDGEPVMIPDSLRSEFFTTNGRSVRDGGGVKPDIILEVEAEAEIIKALGKQNILFKYVNKYVAEHLQIDSAADFQFNEYEQFKSFVGKSDFTYKNEAEKLVEQLREKEYNPAFSTSLNSMEQALTSFKLNELDLHRDQIERLLEWMIVERYYFETGKVQITLRNDAEVDEAIRILNDEESYKKILASN